MSSTLMTPRERLLESALDALGLALWIVDAGGTVEYRNPAARLAQAQAAGLEVIEGQLRALSPQAQPALRRAYEQAMLGVRSLLVPGGEAGRPVVVAPLAGESGRLLVMQGGSSAVEASTLALYARSLGITPSEVEVLSALCEGQAVSEIARHRCVKISTIRAQIGSLRDKTGLRKVGRLLSALAALPPLGPRLGSVPVVSERSALGPVPQAPQRGELLRAGDRQRIAGVA
ncbi:MAG: hypothetical protein RIQ53_3522 [Pseudomonadota bacterium]|jgi:DNA-binding CsgD family transcriptional regulator